MAKAVARPKKIAAKSKASVPARAKPAAAATARKPLKKTPAKPPISKPSTNKPSMNKPSTNEPSTKPVAKPATKPPVAAAPKSDKWVFTFGDGKAEGRADLRDLLGGKGANLAEMANLGLPVPPGFTIPTSVCT